MYMNTNKCYFFVPVSAILHPVPKHRDSHDLTLWEATGAGHVDGIQLILPVNNSHSNVASRMSHWVESKLSLASITADH